MESGGSLFWKYFTEKVADELAKHKFAQLIADLKKLDNYDQLKSCSYCFLPTDGSRCSFCKKVYCNRPYYCQGDGSSGLFELNCEKCDQCHKCDICNKNVMSITCDHEITHEEEARYRVKCGHIFCVKHTEGEYYKCLICESEQN